MPSRTAYPPAETSLRGCVASAAITIPLLLLAACGDTINEQINANVGAVATNDDLPECTESIAGQTAFIKETHEFLGCDGKEWQTLSANTVSVGDNVCTSTSLSDGTGFEIFCNGESIGMVKNGKDGEKGDAGEKGEKGDAGAKGDKGDDGAPGEKGADGKDGAPGTNGANGTNGTNGKDGTPGADGAGCKIQESTALTATIACGSETFTMDLTGYVDVPEACDSSDTSCAVEMDDVELSGVSQKGPFVSGTDVTAYELENGRSLKQTGKTFGGKIENQDGSFNIRTVKLKSSFAYLVADGFYRNEVTGRNSAATIKLRALTNLDGRSTANINLVTHLEYDRVQRLVTKDNKSVIEAKRAAEKSLFAAFNIDNTGFKGFAEDLNIFKEGDGNAALLAVSAMLQGDRDESELTALLAALSVDLGDNGVWDDSLRRAQIADWAMKADIEGRLATIRANVEGWKLSESKAPAFEKHVTHFWTTELGVGECDGNNDGKLFATKNTYSSYYAANDSAFTVGDSSLARLICDASGEIPAWRFATDIEKDTAALAADLPADTAVAGKINTDFVYVKEGTWRRGTALDYRLRASCVSANKGITASDTVKSVVTWYICDESSEVLGAELIPTAWREATTDEADTAGFGVPKTSKDSVRIGNVDKSITYVYENEKWRYGTDLDRVDGLGACVKGKLNAIRHMSTAESAEGWFKCVSNKAVFVNGEQVPYVWREATDYERDTLGWKSASNGTVRTSSYSTTRYVYDGKGWRQLLEAEKKTGLGPCVDAYAGIVRQSGKTDESWYRCTDEQPTSIDGFPVSHTWRTATAQEADTAEINMRARKIAGSDNYTGLILKGNLTKDLMNYYIYESGKWRRADTLEIDTYDHSAYKPWGKSGDADVRTGSVLKNFYVFDKAEGRWRPETSEYDHDKMLKGCTRTRSEHVEINSNQSFSGNASEVTYAVGSLAEATDKNIYLCVDNRWRRASEARINTYGLGIRLNTSYERDAIQGNDGNYYVFEVDTFRTLNESEAWFMDARNYGLSQSNKRYDLVRCGKADEGKSASIGAYMPTTWICTDGYYEWNKQAVLKADTGYGKKERTLCLSEHRLGWHTICRQNQPKRCILIILHGSCLLQQGWSKIPPRFFPSMVRFL